MYTVPKLEDYSPDALDRAVADLLASLDAESGDLRSESDWKTFRDRWLARKNGVLSQVNDTWLKAAPSTAKREVGRRVNELKARAEAAIDDAQTKIHASSVDVNLAADRLDISLPGIQRPIGVKHPVLRVMDEIVAVFKAMGYSVGEGPEVETDYYNFESLNFPPNHPARDTQDTLFIAGQESKPARDRLLLRTHTSP
ncbi:MAG: phenylalanine--tRNA ligase subunit alpha, partial [Candidatus Korobacteraceae bacterium]